MRKKLVSLIALFLFLASCSLFTRSSKPPVEQGPKGNRLAVIGFEPVVLPGERPKAMRDPISGSVFMAEPVSEDKARGLTSRLYRLLSRKGGYGLIDPAKTRKIMLELETSDPALSQRPLELFTDVGKTLGANVVLAGYLYKWRQRKGESYGVREPASVAFSLSLISVKDRRLVWTARFDKTQRSLSENLLDVRTFLKGRGRWMNVEELAQVGLEEAVKGIPVPESEISE